MKNYETEANASNTDAYREHEQKTKNYIKEKWAEVNEKLMTMGPADKILDRELSDQS